MIKKTIIIFTVLFIAIFIGEIIYNSTNINNVALIKLNGIITPSKSQKIIKEIEDAKSDENIKAVLFEINSPGGEACSSEKIYLSLKKLSKQKPVIALIDTIGASGAYFAACGANKIVSYPASTVGSIGVIFETLNFYQLAKRLGISLFVVKTGKVKDVGNPFRKPTEQDKAMIRNLIDNIYTQFLNAVSKSRHIPLDKLKHIANGSVFTGKQALELKLVDSVGGLDQARKFIKQMAKIKKIKFENLSKSGGLEDKILNSLYLADFIGIISQPTAKALYQ